MLNENYESTLQSTISRQRWIFLHSCSPCTLSTNSGEDSGPSAFPSVSLKEPFLFLRLQDPFKRNYLYSFTSTIPISHSYDMYPRQEYGIPTISRYWWGTAIPSIPIKGCTNACLLHSPPEWLYGTLASGDQSDFACHGVHWRMLRRFSTRSFRTVTVPFVCTRVIS
jgi:hypothetical protein